MLKYEIAHPGQPVQVTETAALLYPASLAGEGLSLKFFLLLRHRARFRLPCEGFWAEHRSPSP